MYQSRIFGHMSPRKPYQNGIFDHMSPRKPYQNDFVHMALSHNTKTALEVAEELKNPCKDASMQGFIR